MEEYPYIIKKWGDGQGDGEGEEDNRKPPLLGTNDCTTYENYMYGWALEGYGP